MKLNMTYTIAAALLAIASNGATAAWVDVGATETVTAYVDTATIQKSVNGVTMWDLLDYKKAQDIPTGQSFRSVRAQTEYSCTNKIARPLAASAHTDTMARGGTVHAVSQPGAWRPVAPGSLDEAMWNVACGKPRIS